LELNMSEVNGTALGSRANTADGVAPPDEFDDKRRWLATTEDTAPMDAVDRPTFGQPDNAVTRSTSAGAVATAAPAPNRRRGSEADKLEDELADAERLVAIQMHPLLLKRMSGRERGAAQRSARKVRTALRRENEAAQLAEVRRRVKARRLETELANQDAADQRWNRRAESARQRLTSPASRLADLFSARQRQIRALMAVALVGMLWGAVNVHDILVSHFQISGTVNPGYGLAYGVEPLLTVPLIVLMAHQAKLAEWGRQSGWRDQRVLRLVEGALLLAALAMNAAPHFTEGASALIFVVPPSMIAVSMFVVPIVAAKLGAILLDARDDAAEQASLGDAASALNKFLGRLTSVFDANAAGEIGGERDENGVPSASAIRAHQNVAKGTAITIRKLWTAARS
jgi:hypothetical protein